MRLFICLFEKTIFGRSCAETVYKRILCWVFENEASLLVGLYYSKCTGSIDIGGVFCNSIQIASASLYGI